MSGDSGFREGVATVMSNAKDPKRLRRDELVAYLDGELSAKRKREIESQLNSDSHAKREADALQGAWDLLDSLPQAQPSADFVSRTLARLDAPAAMPKPSPIVPWPRRIGWAAAIVFALLAGYWTINQARTPLPIDSEDLLVQDFRSIENARMFEHVDDIDFLHKLANPSDSDLFGEEGIGS